VNAIDFTLQFEKVPDPKGDRMKVTLDGELFPCNRC